MPRTNRLPQEPSGISGVLPTCDRKENTITDDRSNRGARDRSRINVNEDYELKYWADKWGMSVDELRSVVDQVGPMTEDVAAKIGKRI